MGDSGKRKWCQCGKTDGGLPPELSSVLKFTNAFFETNSYYFVGQAKSVLNLPADETAAQSYYDLVAHEGSESYDDRRSAIEFQYNKSLSLKDKLWAVAMPTSFLDDSTIRNIVLQDWGAYPLTYSIIRGTAPSEYNATIRAAYERWLREGQML